MTVTITVTRYCDKGGIAMSELDNAMQEHIAFIVFQERGHLIVKFS